MTAVFVDTDVLLDVVIKRPDFYPASFQIVQWIEQKRIEAYLTPMTISTIYYLIRKELSHLQALSLIEKLMVIFNVVSIDKSGIISALNSDFKDFEDALQNYSALQHPEIETLITRNIKDYRCSDLAIMTPTDFISYFNTLSRN
jgi:predicted nucleic acid-binding protein